MKGEPAGHVFELRCADVQPVRCGVELRAASAEELLGLACEHGARAHGFTPAWYSSSRLAAMAATVRRRSR
jgi:predicted small metal-binding protein